MNIKGLLIYSAFFGGGTLTLPFCALAASSPLDGHTDRDSSTAQVPVEENLTEAQLDSLERVAYGDAKDLQEVVISADAPAVRVTGNLITYDVEEDPTSAGQSVLDLLRKVPMVSVDGQDNIKVKGNSDFKIYVNGRPEPMLSQNASTILKAMPAESVAKIELISDPGAKFDAEGSGGIINLVTERKQKNDGYNGSLNAGVTTRNVNAGGRIAYRKGNVSLQAGVNYMQTFKGMQTGEVESETIYPGNDGQHRLYSFFRSPRTNNFVSADLGMSWDISPNDLFTFSTNYYRVGGSIKGTDAVTKMFDVQGNTVWSYSRATDLNPTYQGATVNAAYQHNFGRPTNYLSLSYQFNFGNTALPMDFTYADCINYTPAHIHEHNENSSYNREHTVQADYSNQLTEHAKIEAGAKGIFRRNSALADVSGSNDLVTDEPVAGSAVDMRQPQDIYAVYGLYTANYGKFQGSAGVRYEHTRMGVDMLTDPDQSFRTRLNDVVPNASVTYAITPSHILAANYSMRISRPSVEQLNPHRLSLDPTQAQQGNPDLTSEKINKAGLSYTTFNRAFTLNISAEYTHNGNAISAYSFMDGYTLLRTYANIGKKQTGALNAFLMWSPVPVLRLTLSGGATYTDIRASFIGADGKTDNISSHGWGGNVAFSGDWQLPEKFRLGAYLGWNFRNIELQGHMDGFHYYGLSLSRTFLKDDSLTLTLNGSNCFEKWLKFNNYTYTRDAVTSNTYRHPAWTVGLQIAWNFGHSNVKVKEINSAINNDDISKTSAAGAGGSTGAGTGGLK